MENEEKIVNMLNNGGVVVMPTDTIYGILGKAEYENTVERIYLVRRRSPQKPCIILISNEEDVNNFGIALSQEQKITIKEIWNKKEPVSIILDCVNDVEKFFYLHRGTKKLAFRKPISEKLCNFISKTGPLIAPSANTEGEIPSKNIHEAKKYFEDKVDIYVDGGQIESNPSKIIELDSYGVIKIIRE